MNTLLRPGLRAELRVPPPGQFHVPGVDAAFASTAATCGSHAVGVLLTGMGRDGAAGLRTLRDAGALTIGQDEPTSVVWGMPAAAQALGAVEVELPLPAIAAALTAALTEDEQVRP
jgi:two-component system chemotaxis response regulator CheB